METRIETDFSRLTARFEAMKQRSENKAPILDKIASDMLKETQKNFKGKKDPDGSPWRELAEETKKAKIKRGRNPDNILRDKSLLYGSLNAQTTPNTAYVAPGREVVYAAIHNYGGEINKLAQSRKNYFKNGRFSSKRKSTSYKWSTIGEHSISIPQRRYLGINEKNKIKYIKWILKYINEGII